MKISGNTIVITGGYSGIGLALAKAFQSLNNEVIITGRDAARLAEVKKLHPALQTTLLDVNNADSVSQFVQTMKKDYPALNVLINNAGIMRAEDWNAEAIDLSTAELTLATNLLAPLRITAGLLPQLKQQAQSSIITVSSGLAFLPKAQTPTYSATKAAIHAFSESLRYQLRNTSVEVIEIVPPYVQTTLMGEKQANDPHAMPLNEFIAEVIEIIKDNPDGEEVLVKRVLPLRHAAQNGTEAYQAAFNQLNQRF